MGALNVRATIQQALGVVMERDRADAASAYVTVRLQAAEAARSIIEEAHAVIGAQR
jgi:AmiR/NasT family two-component response regulator